MLEFAMAVSTQPATTPEVSMWTTAASDLLYLYEVPLLESSGLKLTALYAIRTVRCWVAAVDWDVVWRTEQCNAQPPSDVSPDSKRIMFSTAIYVVQALIGDLMVRHQLELSLHAAHCSRARQPSGLKITGTPDSDHPDDAPCHQSLHLMTPDHRRCSLHFHIETSSPH
jgi:hypothetical protein